MAYLALIGTALGAVNQYAEGQQAKKLADRDASTSRATSQRDAITDRKRAMLLKSRALAVAAASGGGVDDPTVSKLLGDIGAAGEMNALGTLWEGNEIGTGLELQGRARRSEGRARAVSSILSEGSAMYDKYDGGSGGGSYRMPSAQVSGTAAADYQLNPRYGNYV
jgi:hypothetical protein